METLLQTTLAPPAVEFVPAPAFKYAPSQKEVDFAQFVACGVLPRDAVVRSGIVPLHEARKLHPSHIYQHAARLLKSPAVQERMDHFHALHRASMNITAERLQQELAASAFVDPAEVMVDKEYTTVEADGTETTRKRAAVQDDLRKLPRYVRAAIKEFYIDRDGQPRIKFQDKMKSIQMLGDAQGLFNEAHQAKAPQITFNLGGSSTPLEDAIDITPAASPPSPPLPPPVPEFMR